MKLLDLLNEVEKEERPVKEMTPVVEAEGIPIDEIGKFFIVEKPTQKSEMEDVVYEITLPEFALQIKGGLDIKNILGVYKQKSDARRAATEAIKAYETNLKEMEDAMEAFRGAKKDIEEKRKTCIRASVGVYRRRTVGCAWFSFSHGQNDQIKKKTALVPACVLPAANGFSWGAARVYQSSSSRFTAAGASSSSE